MGDVSAEPSMEEILSSIKRIIAEEGDGPPARTRRATPRPVPVIEDDDDPEVLELNDPMPARTPEPTRAAPPSVRASEPARDPEPAKVAEPARAAETILSNRAAEATRGSLDALTRLVTRPEPGSDGTLEGLVREMLRPMLRDWLDANLPAMVETMVAREIAKITGEQG